jgi:hypothetical protein
MLPKCLQQKGKTLLDKSANQSTKLALDVELQRVLTYVAWYMHYYHVSMNVRNTCNTY